MRCSRVSVHVSFGLCAKVSSVFVCGGGVCVILGMSVLVCLGYVWRVRALSPYKCACDCILIVMRVM